MASSRAHFNRAACLVAAALLSTPAARARALTCPGPQLPRLVAVGGLYVAGEATGILVKRHEWWTTPAGGFHVTWDASATREQDRLLHAAFAYHGAQAGAAVLRWACLGEPTATWLGAALGLALELPKEIGDGFHPDHGFSGPDMLAATLGALLPAVRATWPPSRFLALKVQYWPSAEYRDRDGQPEPRLESDYAGQRYFVAISPGVLGRTAPWPRWLGVALGHSVPYWASQPPVHEWYAALDLRFESLPIGGPIWRRVAWVLDQIHLPAPGVRLRQGSWTVGVY